MMWGVRLSRDSVSFDSGRGYMHMCMNMHMCMHMHMHMYPMHMSNV